MRCSSLLPFSVLIGLCSGCEGLQITAVSPEIIPAGQTGTLDIHGLGFSEQTRFSLVTQGITVSLAMSSPFSAERVSATVPATAPPGRYSVVAEEHGTRAELPAAVQLVSGQARIIFVDVGQGDATLLVAPGGETLLIDGGPLSASAAVSTALARYAAGRLDAVVLSHVDADHLAGLVAVLAGPDGRPGTEDDLRPSQAWGPGDTSSCTTQTCDAWRRLLSWPFAAAEPGTRFPVGDVDVELVAANGDVGDGPLSGADDDNEHSVVALIRFGGRRVLITGDLTGGGLGTVDLESPLASRTGPIDVLRVSHHGSNTSSAGEALAQWQPAAAILSVGTDNAYCHPSPDVLDRLSALGAEIWSTGGGVVEDGTRCGGTTTYPAGSQWGVGDILLTLEASGGYAFSAPGP